MVDCTLSRNDLWSLSAEILRSGNRLRFRAKGVSMMPFVRDGELLVIQPTSNVRFGDIVLCRTADERVIVHRVVSVGNGGILTQGDACRQPDSIVTEEDVLGRVVAVERGKRVQNLDEGLQRWLGVLWITLSPISRIAYRILADLLPD